MAYIVMIFCILLLSPLFFFFFFFNRKRSKWKKEKKKKGKKAMMMHAGFRAEQQFLNTYISKNNWKAQFCLWCWFYTPKSVNSTKEIVFSLSRNNETSKEQEMVLELSSGTNRKWGNNVIERFLSGTPNNYVIVHPF